MKISSLIRLFFCVNLLTISSPLRGEWIPEEFITNYLDPSTYSRLFDKDFIALKTIVTETLKTSWCSKEKVNLLMDLVRLIQPQISVEIGAYIGSSVLPVASTLKLQQSGKIFAIDAWSNQEAIRYLADNDPNKTWWSTVDMVATREIFDRMISFWHLNNICLPIQGSSKNAAELVQEIDFLHLDGNFSEPGSCSDVALYLPKVKQGGYILLSNICITINGEQPKLESFYMLFNECEMVCEVENSNAILFRKKIADVT